MSNESYSTKSVKQEEHKNDKKKRRSDRIKQKSCNY